MSKDRERSSGNSPAQFLQLVHQSWKVILVFPILVLCLGQEYFHHLSIQYKLLAEIRDEVFAAVQAFDTQWMVVTCALVYIVGFIWLRCRQNNKIPGSEKLRIFFLLLLAVFAVAFYAFIYHESAKTTDALVLIFGMSLGQVFGFWGETKLNVRRVVLTLFVVLLALASLWHTEPLTAYQYHGQPRWKGIWDNPNTFGMLIGAGLLLAIGMLAGRQNEEGRSQKSEVRMKKIIAVILFTAAGMMAVGLLFSYSRGSWAGAVIGLLYLAKVYGKFKWRYLLPVLFITAAVICFCLNTPDSSPWYVKRLDLSRGSVTHRLAAWHGALQMMRDHPLGVGWNKAVEIYAKDYSPPENSAVALNTNDYLMLGTQLGFPGLFCFVAYAGLCFRSPKSKVQRPKSEFGIQAACRAGALALLVAFWFDGGLFKLATAAVFWILLELGANKEPPPSAFVQLRRDKHVGGHAA